MPDLSPPFGIVLDGPGLSLARGRGSAIPALRGTYLYGDNCTGHIWGIQAAEAAAGAARPELILESGLAVSSFGEDRDGELYVTDLSGSVYQVVPAS